MLFNYLPFPEDFRLLKEDSFEFDDHKINFLMLDCYPSDVSPRSSYYRDNEFDDRPPELMGMSEEKIQFLRESTLASYWLEKLPYLSIEGKFRQVAFGLLGEKSYACRVIIGLGLDFLNSAKEAAELMRIFVLADLNDLYFEGISEWRIGEHFYTSRLLMAYGARFFIEKSLYYAADERDAILEELAAVVKDPQAAIENLGDAIAQDLKKDWRDYQAYMKENTLESRFRAGLICGKLPAAVVGLLCGVVGLARTGAALATKLPRLLKLARNVKPKPKPSAPRPAFKRRNNGPPITPGQLAKELNYIPPPGFLGAKAAKGKPQPKVEGKPKKDELQASASGDKAAVLVETNSPDSSLIKGAAFRHQTKWAPNATGPRSKSDALRLADDNGVYVADDVKIRFIDDVDYDLQFGQYGDSFASYGHVRTQNLGQQLTFRDALADKDGNINVFVRNSVLDSDEAIVAVLHHETHEIEALRDIFAKRVSMSAREYRSLVNGSTPGNLHWEAVDVGDQAVWQLRQDRGL